MLCGIRDLSNVAYCTLTHQSSGNWRGHVKQHASCINFEKLELYWTHFLALQPMTSQIPPIRLMSLDHEPKMRCCAMSLNHGLCWDNIAMGFGSWALASFCVNMGFFGLWNRFTQNNEITPWGMKNLSSAIVSNNKTFIN